MLGLTPATGRPPKQLCVPASNLELQRGRMLAQIPFGVQMIEANPSQGFDTSLKAADSRRLVGKNFEDGEQFCNLQKVVNLFCQMQ